MIKSQGSFPEEFSAQSLPVYPPLQSHSEQKGALLSSYDISIVRPSTLCFVKGATLPCEAYASIPCDLSGKYKQIPHMIAV